MEKPNADHLKKQIESRLLERIQELETVQLELQAETNNSTGEEKDKNQKLLNATSDLLHELRQAQTNIHNLYQGGAAPQG